MNPVVEALLTVSPRRVQAVELLHRLYDGGSTPDTQTLLRLGPEIESALDDVQELAAKTAKVVARCSKLSPVPIKSAPPGF